MRTHTTTTDTTRYYLALYTVLVVHSLRNLAARVAAETDPLHDLWYNGLDQPGQGTLDTTAVPLGELLSAGHGAVMGDDASSWTEAGELAGVEHDLESYECHDSDGDYRNRYFSSSEGMTDTVEVAMAPVVADPAIRNDEGEVVEEATLYDARWACLKDGHLEEESSRKHAESRPAGEASEFGAMSHYAEWRKSRATRLVRMARVTGTKGRLALRNGNGDGYRAALDLLDRIISTTTRRYKSAVNAIVAKGKASGQPENKWDWFALYLTREQLKQVTDACRYEANRLHTAFRK